MDESTIKVIFFFFSLWISRVSLFNFCSSSYSLCNISFWLYLGFEIAWIERYWEFLIRSFVSKGMKLLQMKDRESSDAAIREIALFFVCLENLYLLDVFFVPCVDIIYYFRIWQFTWSGWTQDFLSCGMISIILIPRDIGCDILNRFVSCSSSKFPQLALELKEVTKNFFLFTYLSLLCLELKLSGCKCDVKGCKIVAKEWKLSKRRIIDYTVPGTRVCYWFSIL